MQDEAERAFLELAARAQACRRCPRMEGRARVLSLANGSLRAKALVVAEAPGRLGADRSHIPLSGDQTGRNFEALLQGAGLDRRDLFVTNAVLCNPRDAQGRNASPTVQEIANCVPHLRETIAILQPAVVVALGSVALRALAQVAPHDAVLAADAGRCLRWHDRWLLPLYHPGPRARRFRSFAQQAADFQQLAMLLTALKTPAL